MPSEESNLTLTPREKAILIKWIEDGAEYKKHWAFIPPKQTDLPKVKDKSWAKNPIDQFVLSKLEQEYVVEVSGSLTPAQLQRLNHGLVFNGTALPPCKVSWQNETRLRFALKNPLPGQLVFMCNSVDLPVPLRPTRATRWPAGMVTLAPSSLAAVRAWPGSSASTSAGDAPPFASFDDAVHELRDPTDGRHAQLTPRRAGQPALQLIGGRRLPPFMKPKARVG